MRISVFATPLLIALALPATLQSQDDVPVMRTVDPLSAKVGDIVVIQGEYLGAENVAAVYLTDGVSDFKVLILEQTATSIRVRVPREAKLGRLNFMVLTKGKPPKLIEEPVKITIEPETSNSAN